MALRFCCDGCECTIDEKDAKKRGALDLVMFCADCATTWDAYVAAEAAKRAEIVAEFEAWRAEQFAALKAGGLKTLPDEWIAPVKKTDAPTDAPAHDHGGKGHAR